MLTVKHIAISGEEMIYPTPLANFVPANAKQCTPKWDSLWIEMADGRRYEFSEGSIYVMNEHGKTVAHYSLHWPNSILTEQAIAA